MCAQWFVISMCAQCCVISVCAEWCVCVLTHQCVLWKCFQDSESESDHTLCWGNPFLYSDQSAHARRYGVYTSDVKGVVCYCDITLPTQHQVFSAEFTSPCDQLFPVPVLCPPIRSVISGSGEKMHHSETGKQRVTFYFRFRNEGY